MMRPEITLRIRETCTESLQRWHTANLIEADKPWYNNYSALRQEILDEANYIKALLAKRKEI